MAYKYFFGIILTHNMLLYCASAAVHGHSLENVERDSDGSFRARDSEHYSDSGHNSEFDHEAILGSVKEAEEFDNLSPEESKKRLAELIPKMDLNGDQQVDRAELKQWILKSFQNLAREEAQERLEDTDDNHDGVVTWEEYLQTFGVDSENDVSPDDTGDSGMPLRQEKAMWGMADVNNDGELDLTEFEVFTNPEEHEKMHEYLINQTLREKDLDQDGVIDFMEFVKERGSQQDKEWYISQQDKFDNDLDLNNDGVMDLAEIKNWILPNNDDIATEEVDHLFATADDNHDNVLSMDEILEHHSVFVGSSDTSSDILGDHFDDEL